MALALAAACDAQSAPASAPTRPFLVVANQRTGSATLVELTSGRMSHVELGRNPHEVAVAPGGQIAALTVPSERFGASRTVVVLDLATTTVERTIELGSYRGPHGIAFLSDSVAIIGTLSGTSAVFVNVRNGRILRAVDGLPANPYVVKTTRTGRAFVSSPHSGQVSEIDLATAGVLRTITIPGDPSGIAVSADGKELYAALWTDETPGAIAIYDLEKGTVVARLPATQPRRLTITNDQKLVVASDRDHLRIIDRGTRQVRSVFLGQNAGGSGVTCSPDAQRCYVALSQAGEIVEVDVPGARVLRRFRAQRGVDGVDFVPR